MSLYGVDPEHIMTVAFTCKHSVLISVLYISQHGIEKGSNFGKHQEAVHLV